MVEGLKTLEKGAKPSSTLLHIYCQGPKPSNCSMKPFSHVSKLPNITVLDGEPLCHLSRSVSHARDRALLWLSCASRLFLISGSS